MRFISGIAAAAFVGTLMLLPAAAPAQAGGFGGGGHGGGIGGGFGGRFGGRFPGHHGGLGPLPGVGANAYAPGQGPTGAAGWNFGSWHGFTRGPFGYFGGCCGGYGGYDFDGAPIPLSGGAPTNVLTYNHYDNRRRDGGFYGGGGVFYGDDGYSRLYTIRPPDYDGYPTSGPTGYAPGGVYRPSQHIFYLPDNNPPAAKKAARHDDPH